MKRDYAIGGDNQNIRGMKEDREKCADLAGIELKFKTDQDMWSSFRGLANAERARLIVEL
jgi:hypothetical protein